MPTIFTDQRCPILHLYLTLYRNFAEDEDAWLEPDGEKTNQKRSRRKFAKDPTNQRKINGKTFVR